MPRAARLAALAAVSQALMASMIAAQGARTGTVMGAVRDSIAGGPLAHAVVQLAADGGAGRFTRAVRADSLGRFRIDSVPPGAYAVGFQHARLDSLGVRAAVQTVRVTAGRTSHAMLASPSVALLRSTYCSDAPRGGTIVLGHVRRASDRAPLAGAVVSGEWVEFVMGRRGALARRQPLVEVHVSDDGAFALCGLPGEGSMYVRAAAGRDSTDRIELVADGSGVVLRDLFVGTARSVVSTDATEPGDSGTPRTRTRRAGNGIVRGRVSGPFRGMPVPNALVRVADGPQVRTDARGEFALAGIPDGTRVIEIRAIGHVPQQLPVDVLPGGATVDVELWTFQALLDTVNVRELGGDRSGGGFARRERTYGAGNFMDSAAVARRGGRWTSDVFRAMNGVRIGGVGLDTIVVRSAFDWCQPSFYIDGLYMAALLVGELDALVDRARIMAIEVYPGGAVPAEFARGLDACGAIVIWTKPPRASPRLVPRPTGGERPGK